MEFFGAQVMEIFQGRIAAMIIGGAAGFLYYRFVGCKTGTCPLTGNPWISALYGAALGFLAVSH